jgi:hypothetical protein
LGLGLLAVVRGDPEMALPSERALAILMVRDPDRMFVGRIARVPILAPDDRIAPTTGFAVVAFDAGDCEAVVHHVDAGGSFLVFGEFEDDDEDEPGYVRIHASRTFLDVDLDRMCSEVEEAARAKREGTLPELVAPLLEGATLEQVRDRARPWRERSRFGGVPPKAELPPGDFRYVMRLGGEFFDVLFGENGSLHVWLGHGDALLLSDSA